MENTKHYSIVGDVNIDQSLPTPIKFKLCLGRFNCLKRMEYTNKQKRVRI